MLKAPSTDCLFVVLAGALAVAGCAHIQISVGPAVPTPAAASPSATVPETIECRQQNQFDCSSIVPIFVDGQSEMTAIWSAGGILDVAFNNRQNGSGLAFVFKPALDVRGFSSVEIHIASSRESAFVLEYKVQTQNGPAIAATSARQVFPMSSEAVTVTVPMSYDGAISELVINFLQMGDAAQLKIEAIYFGK